MGGIIYLKQPKSGLVTSFTHKLIKPLLVKNHVFTWHFGQITGWKSIDSIPKLVTDYKNKIFDLDILVTHTLPFDKINEAFDLMNQGKR